MAITFSVTRGKLHSVSRPLFLSHLRSSSEFAFRHTRGVPLPPSLDRAHTGSCLSSAYEKNLGRLLALSIGFHLPERPVEAFQPTIRQLRPACVAHAAWRLYTLSGTVNKPPRRNGRYGPRGAWSAARPSKAHNEESKEVAVRLCVFTAPRSSTAVSRRSTVSTTWTMDL